MDDFLVDDIPELVILLFVNMAPFLFLNEFCLLEMEKLVGCLFGLDTFGDFRIGEHQIVMEIVFG